MRIQTILTPYFLDQPLPSLELLAEPDWIINRENLPEASLISRLSVLHAALAGKVEKVLAQGDLPVSIAGDCPTALGIWAALSRADLVPTLVWLDAHGDFNTWETTPSGFLGGMPLAMLTGLGEQTILESLEVEPMPQERVILSDARDLDPGERELVGSSGIKHLPDPQDLVDFPYPQGALWVHFDTDIVDPAQSPAQNYPAAGGPDRELMARVFRSLRDTGLVKVVSLSSWNPELPGADASQRVSLELLDILLGRMP
jgi:arginase